MRKARLWVNALAIALSLLLVFPAGMVSAAGSKAEISHKKPGDAYFPGFRINLDATITDADGILTARCYFKSKNDKNFAFVKMMGGSGSYKAVLPAPFVGSEEIHYLFVSVNTAKKVTRTEIFTLKEAETKEGIKWKDVSDVKEVRLDQIQDTAEKLALLYENNKSAYIKKLPEFQTASPYGPIDVGTELPTNQVRVNGFYDDTASVREVPMAEKYGLAAKGLYAPDAVAAAGGAGVSGSAFAGTVTAGKSGSGFLAGLIGLGAVAGGIAAASSSSDDDGGGGGGGTTPPASGGLTAADIPGTWSLTGASSDWHSASSGPYVFNSGGTYTGLASSATGPRSVSGTWSLDETAQTFTMTETTGFGATVTNAAITGTASPFTVQGQLPANGYTNNSGTFFAPNTADTFTFTKQ